MATRWLGVAALLCIAAEASADQTYVCSYGKNERVISVIYNSQATRLPCDVRYENEGITKMLWSSVTEPDYCDRQAKTFVDKQIMAGWRCESVSDGGARRAATVGVPSGTGIQTDPTKAAIGFSQALATITPIKLTVTEFYYENGAFPQSLKDVGLAPADMKTSTHISDLTIAGHGQIYIKGNEMMGLDSVIMLKPQLVLGGTSLEWRCFTNIKMNAPARMPVCEYKPYLRFQ